MISIILLFLHVALMYLFGWSISTRILKIKKLSLLLPSSMFIGWMLQIFLVNIFSYPFTVRSAVYISEVLLIGISIYLLWRIRLKPDSRANDVSNVYFFLTAIFAVVCTVIVLGITLKQDMFDVGMHYPVIATLTYDNFPMVSPYDPGDSLTYHYAIDLSSVAVHVLAGIPVWYALSFNFILVAFFTPFLLFGIMGEAVKSKLSCFLATALFCWGDGFEYLKIFFSSEISELRQSFFNGSISFIHFLSTILETQGQRFLKGSTCYPFLDKIWGASTTPGIPFYILVLFLLLYVLRYSRRKRDIGQIVLVGILFGFLALLREDLFGILSIVFGGYFIWIWASTKKFPKVLFYCLLIGSLLTIFQGGVITDKVFGRVQTQSWGHELSFRSVPAIPTWDAKYASFDYAVPLGGTWIPYLLTDLGVGLLFFPFLYFVFKKRDHFIRLFAIFVFIGFFFALFFELKDQNYNLARTIHMDGMYCFVGLVFGDFLTRFKNKKFTFALSRIFIIILILIAASGSTLLWHVQQLALPKQRVEGAFLDARDENKRFLSYQSSLDPEAIEWLHQNVPPKNVILNVPLDSGYFVTGRHILFGIQRARASYTARKTLNKDALRFLGAHYIYLTEWMFNELDPEVKETVYNILTGKESSGDFQLLFSRKKDTMFRAILRVLY